MRPWRATARRGTLIAVSLAALTLTQLAWAQDASLPPRTGAADDTAAAPGTLVIPAPVGYVNDVAGVLDEPTRAKLEAFLDQVHTKTQAQFAVLIVPTTAPLDPDEYKVKVFEQWGIGDKARDDGLLMLVALKERKVRFETGYGLEGALPDGLQSRIFREEMAPRFRADDYPGGIIAGVLASSARIAAEHDVKLEWNGEELRYSAPRRERLPLWAVLLLVLLAVVFMSVAGAAGRRRRGPGGFGDWGGGFGGFGGGFGGGSFGGGGFGGGGGGGGGGGSFGGFGGGGSGGGGGGGSW